MKRVLLLMSSAKEGGKAWFCEEEDDIMRLWRCISLSAAVSHDSPGNETEWSRGASAWP